MGAENGLPVVGAIAGLLTQFALGGGQDVLAGGSAALGKLPGIDVQGVAVLTHQQNAVMLIEGDDTHGAVAVVDDAVDAGLAVRPHNLVVPDDNPGILIDDGPR